MLPSSGSGAATAELAVLKTFARAAVVRMICIAERVPTVAIPSKPIGVTDPHARPTFASECLWADTRQRPLLSIAEAGDHDALAAALDAEARAEMAKDRAYWEPLKRELEAMRLAEARDNRA